MGLDDAHLPAFASQQQQLSELVQASGAMAAARALARRGLLPDKRAGLWHLALGLQPSVGAAEQQEFDELCRWVRIQTFARWTCACIPILG